MRRSSFLTLFASKKPKSQFTFKLSATNDMLCNYSLLHKYVPRMPMATTTKDNTVTMISFCSNSSSV